MLLSVFLDLRELVFVVVLNLDNDVCLIVAFSRRCLVALELALGRQQHPDFIRVSFAFTPS